MRSLRLFNIIWGFLTAAAFILIVYGFYQTFHRVQILQVRNEPVPILGDNIRAGDPINIQLSYCKLTDDPADVTPELIGQDVPNRYLPTFISDVRTGCYDQAITIGNVPLSASAGTYTVRLVVQYEINVLHRQFVTIESQPFDVAPGKVLYLN